MKVACVVLLCQLAAVLAATPVGKVVTLLKSMKAEVEKDQKDDAASHAKFMCWCESNDQEKDQEVATAEATIKRLEASIEQGTGNIARLEAEVEDLTEDIAKTQKSLDDTTALRAKENGEFKADQDTMTDMISTLAEAIAVLEKVQGGASLLQVKTALQRVKGGGLRRFDSIMQRDFWDLMGSLDTHQGALRAGRTLSALEESQLQPERPEGAKSYNSRSGRILGVLQQMLDGTKTDKASSQEAEDQAVASFQKLRDSLLARTSTQTASLKSKKAELAATEAAKARDTADLADTNDQLSADQKFLLNLEARCKQAQAEYEARDAERSEEIRALGETIAILTADDARDLFRAVVPDFLQLGSAAERKLMRRAMSAVVDAAKRNQDWALMSLAVRTQLDPFTKVRAAIDKMIAELQRQQRSESEHRETCLENIDKMEDTIKALDVQRGDLDRSLAAGENAKAGLEAEVAEHKHEIAQGEVSLKEASVQRKAEDVQYQKAVADTRLTIEILRQAKQRLQAFYAKAGLLQEGAGQPELAAASSPAPGTESYQQHKGAAGVMELLERIIKDTQGTEAELVLDEQHAQTEYAKLVADSNEALDELQKSIGHKNVRISELAAGNADLEEQIAGNANSKASTNKALTDEHAECDFFIKYFDVRQQKFAEEIDALGQAKAILAGDVLTGA